MSESSTPIPVVSVVIPTRNRSRLLRELIESLWAQTLPPNRFEIIVVDNLSTDDTPELIRELQDRSPCPIVYHRMEINRGPTPSRNQGAKLARAEIVAFTDSDCRADPHWLERGLALFSDHVAFVSGSVLNKPGQTVKFFARTDMRLVREDPTYPTANIFYRRRVYWEVGGMDENLCFRDFLNRPAECADTDFAWRIKERGYRNVFTPEAIVYHEVEQQTPWAWMGEPFRLYVVPALVKRHPALRAKLLQGGIFFGWPSAWFELGLVGVGLAITVHRAFALGALPYLVWAATARLRPTLGRLLKLPIRVALLTARQAFMSAGLIYGSIRFRSLVL